MKKLLLALFLGYATAVVLQGQSSTSSAINGFVLGEGDVPLNDARVEIVHEPTGTLQTLQTRANGRFQAAGLRPGGPYTVRVRADGYQSQMREDVFLSLGSDQRVDFALRSLQVDSVFELDSFEVIATDSTMAFSELSKGPRTIIDETDLRMLPTVSRSLSDFTRLDPRMAVIDRSSGAMSAGGANTRYNTLLIDGVPTNDSFGLNPNGLPSLKQPFSLDSIAAISVEVSPYSVEQAGFTGASIRTITKSGTNDLRGSVFAYFNNADLTGKLYDTDGTLVPYKDYEERTLGFSLGGPILRDRLFFFVNMERVEESVVQDIGDYRPTQTALNRIIDFSRDVYGFDPGFFEQVDSAKFTDTKLLLKLDWNIDDRHRASFRFNQTSSKEPRYPGLGTGGISLSSRWYRQVLENRDYTAELFSSWTPDFSTEILVSYRRYNSDRLENSDLPSISISGIEGFSTRQNPDGSFSSRTGTVSFGRLNSGHANSLNVDTTIVRLKGIYRMSDHTLTAGIQLERFDNYNLFVTDALGTWQYLDGITFYAPMLEDRFDTNAAQQGGRASSYRYTIPTVGDGAANWSMTTISAYLQDEWQVNPRLNIVAGLRLDLPIVHDSPPEAVGSPDGRSFAEVFGYDNTATLDGNYVLQSRIGFTYRLSEETLSTLRGGVGLFYGRAPHVWVSTTYVDNGRTLESYFAIRGDTPPFAVDPPVLDQPETIRNRVNLLNPDFKMPTEWKYNLAWDRKLPLLDIVLTLEAQWSHTQANIHYEHLNLKQRATTANISGFLPDGRVLYDSSFAREREQGFGDVLMLTNTDKGKTANYTLELKRPMINNWSARMGYTYSKADSVNDGLAFSAFENWTFNTAFNPNDAQLGTARFETRHRVVASASYQIEWLKRHRTVFTVVYDGRSGRPFSYVYGGPFSGNAADINKDRIVGTNDLIYVPSGIDDPLVEWGPNNNARDTRGVAFMEFVDSTPGLAKYKGQVVPRNTGRAPFFHQFDINITHEIRTWNHHTLEFICSIQNVGNLLNDSWGKERRPVGSNNTIGVMRPLHIPIARGDKGNENGYYRYEFDETAIEQRNFYQTRDAGSRWSILLGLRYNF